MDIFLTIIQYVGAVSFTISATIYAIHKRADIIGALVFSLLTCFGGGAIRDIVLGQLPPQILVSRDAHYLALVSIGVCLVCYHFGFFKKIARFADRHQHSFLIEFTDSLGLASFTVSGLEIAIEYGKTGFVILVFAGCITGVGGGILRDICSAEIPSVFKKHIYLIPVIIASVFFALTYDKIPEILSVIIACVIIISIRMLAFKFKWNLPIPRAENKEQGENESKSAETKETELERELSHSK
ncbi:MAG: trimeric intracellular cation channel family protein [Clostridia bacterium]|nr:trimeric intracellular cation channel family protein [Clostridia bacterium]